MLTNKQKERLKNTHRVYETERIHDALARKEQVVTCVYDFSDGAGTGDVALNNTHTFGEAMIVTKVIASELTELTSGGSATVQLKAGSTALTDAEAFDDGFTGADELALASSATAIEVAADDTLQVAIGTAALTAGRVRFYVYAVPKRDM